MIKLLIIFLFSGLITACNPIEQFYDPVVVQESFHKLDSDWHHEDSLEFDLNISEPGNYNVQLILRHERNYPFRNIWVSAYRKSPSGETRFNKKEMDVATPTGVWRGTETGNWVFQRIPLFSGTSFDEKGTHKLSVRHIMREDYLSSVHTVGIRLEKRR